MEETLEGGRGPPRAVAPLEREREREKALIGMYNYGASKEFREIIAVILTVM
jgi:hypothetical protein